ncbi:MAG: MBL fold metallo-hydrolase [Pseudomonadales bacterium]|nr:MBL fold metallo-hydrolase [Pseudomonadales bacterium]
MQIGGDLAIKHQDSYSEYYMRLGVDEKTVQSLPRMYALFSRLMSPVPGTFHRMKAGDIIDIGSFKWKVMIGHGHSPEHACLYCEEKNMIIGGDQLLPGITPSISASVEEIDSNALKEFLDSLEQLYTLPADVLVLPSHQLPYRGVHTRIDQLKAHHSSRCDMLREACEEPKNAFELVGVLFGRRKLGPMDKLMAMGETIAHINLLLNEGEVCRYLDDNEQYLFVLEKKC